MLDWLQDFLIGRKMRVVIHGSSSDYVDVTSGVPQGSFVGPILFLIYINYVASALNSQYAFFADDFKLFLSLPQQKSSDNAEINMLQADINLVYETSNSWGLDFFLHKCCAMHFVRGRSDYPVPSYIINSIPLNVVRVAPNFFLVCGLNFQ